MDFIRNPTYCLFLVGLVSAHYVCESLSYMSDAKIAKKAVDIVVGADIFLPQKFDGRQM